MGSGRGRFLTATAAAVSMKHLLDLEAISTAAAAAAATAATQVGIAVAPNHSAQQARFAFVRAAAAQRFRIEGIEMSIIGFVTIRRRGGGARRRRRLVPERIIVDPNYFVIFLIVCIFQVLSGETVGIQKNFIVRTITTTGKICCFWMNARQNPASIRFEPFLSPAVRAADHHRRLRCPRFLPLQRFPRHLSKIFVSHSTIVPFLADAPHAR